MIPLSWSALKDSECPFRFHALRIAKAYKEPQGAAAEIGSHVAEVLKTYREYCIKKGVPSDIEFLVRAAANKTPDPEKTEKIMGLIERFLNSNLVNIPLTTVWRKIEAKIAFDANLNPLPERDGWFAKNVAFRMVSDFAYIHDRTLWIIDDKTGRGDSDKRQVDYYADLLQRIAPTEGMNGFDRVVCILNQLGMGRVDIVAEYPPGPIAGVREEIMEHLARVNAWTEFPAVACSQCKWCTVPDCPIRNETETALIVSDQNPVTGIPTSITTRQQAEKAVLFLVFAENITDRVKELLRNYVQEHGAVMAGGKVAEERPNNPWKVKDLERLVKTLLAFGVPSQAIWPELSLSESAIEKLTKKAKIQSRLPVLLAMGERKEYKPRFGLFNDKLF